MGFFIYLQSVERDGILAQLGEHLPYKQRVTGSSPVGPIYQTNVCRADVAQWQSS